MAIKLKVPNGPDFVNNNIDVQFDLAIKKLQKKQYRIVTIRLNTEEYAKLDKLAKEKKLKFHRFVKAVLNGYAEYNNGK